MPYLPSPRGDKFSSYLADKLRGSAVGDAVEEFTGPNNPPVNKALSVMGAISDRTVPVGAAAMEFPWGSQTVTAMHKGAQTAKNMAEALKMKSAEMAAAGDVKMAQYYAARAQQMMGKEAELAKQMADFLRSEETVVQAAKTAPQAPKKVAEPVKAVGPIIRRKADMAKE